MLLLNVNVLCWFILQAVSNKENIVYVSTTVVVIIIAFVLEHYEAIQKNKLRRVIKKTDTVLSG